jgi:hypothetical protein
LVMRGYVEGLLLEERDMGPLQNANKQD